MSSTGIEEIIVTALVVSPLAVAAFYLAAGAIIVWLAEDEF
jgi:hypothetical protein